MSNARGKDIYKSNETAEQEAVIEYCDLMSIPIVHIPNEGKRSVSYAAQLKRLGLRSGFPDLFVPLAQGGYFALFIEMKSNTGKLSKEQKEWLLRLKNAGYRAVVCRGADEAIEEIKNYLKGEVTDKHLIRQLSLPPSPTGEGLERESAISSPTDECGGCNACREEFGRTAEDVCPYKVLLFAFVWNRTTYPLGKSLGKSEREIAEKTFETVAAASSMVDISKFKTIMETYKNDRG